DHSGLRGHAAEHALDQVGGFVEAEAFGEAPLEVGLGERAGLELSQIGQRRGILAEEALDCILVEALLATEVAEAVPDRGRQDAAEVDYESLPRDGAGGYRGRTRWHRRRGRRGMVHRQRR